MLLLVPRNKTTDARLDQRVLPAPGFAAAARNIRGNVNIDQGTCHWKSVCRDASHPWLADIVLTPTHGGRWVFKKDNRITLPLDHALAARDGVEYLKPEIAILHKAHLMRQKDEADFDSLLPALDDRARDWLDNALALYLPAHPWRTRL